MVKVGMLGTLRVQDVMTEALLLLRADTSLDTAWTTLHGAGLGGAPVLDDRRPLVGVLSIADLADPRRRVEAAVVADAMTHVVYAVRATDSAWAAVHLMLRENIHRVVVVDDRGALVGIVVPTDVLRALVNEDDAGVAFVDLRKLQSE
jgi:CBS domain-containing protein